MKKLSIATIIAFSATSYCGISQATETRSTYAGIDAVYNSMKFKGGYGDNVISKKSAPGLNLFVGHMFHNNFGAEVGFEIEKKMKRSSTVYPGALVSGVLVQPGYISFSYDSTIKQRHPYLGVLGKCNLFDNTFISFLVGGSLSHINAKYIVTSSGAGPAYNGTTKSFSKTKLIPVIKASLEHKVTDRFGIRALITWKNTSAIKMTAKENGTSTLKPKNTFNLGIGALYYI